MYAILDKDSEHIHSDRYFTREDAEFALEDIAYEYDIDESELKVIYLKD